MTNNIHNGGQMVPSREELDLAMSDVLRLLEQCSHVPAAGYQPRGTSGKPEDKIPTGDLGAEAYRRLYGEPFHFCTSRCAHRRAPATTDERRYEVLEEAKADLKHAKGGPREIPEGETAIEYRRRVLAETENCTPGEVAASRLRVAENTLRKWRRQDGRHTETGLPLTAEPVEDIDERVALVMARLDGGMSERQVAFSLGISRALVQKYRNADRATRAA